MLITSKRKAVYEKLKAALTGGTFPPGSRLPNEPELAEKLGVSRLTLRYVLAQLERENTLKRIKGKGTFVKDVHDNRIRILAVLAKIPNFTQEGALINELHIVSEKYNALLEPVEPAIARNLSDDEIKEAFASGRYQGLIYISFNLDENEEVRSVWKKLGVPSVFFFFNSHFTPRNMPSNALIINCDAPGMIREALKYLGNCGHRRVAVLLSGNINCVSKKETAALLDECRMDVKNSMILDFPQMTEAISVIQKKLNSEAPPTAICCGSSVAALAIYHMLTAQGMRLPEDMAVIAVGQSPLGADLLTPALTTVFCQWQEFAETAWQYLLTSMLSLRKKVPAPARKILKNYIFERQSTEHTLISNPIQGRGES